MKNLEYLNKLYKRNNLGEYIIEVYIEKFLSAFNEWDSAYLEIRELNPSLIYFIERCSDDIPISQNVELRFIVSEKNREQEKVLKKALKTNFDYQLYLTKQQLQFLYKKCAKYFAISLIFLLTAFTLKPIFQLELLGDLINEGLFIGGWVFLWQSISLFSFDSSEMIRKKKIFERLLKSDVTIEYRSQS